jgi:hypothetical protein
LESDFLRPQGSGDSRRLLARHFLLSFTSVGNPYGKVFAGGCREDENGVASPKVEHSPRANVTSGDRFAPGWPGSEGIPKCKNGCGGFSHPGTVGAKGKVMLKALTNTAFFRRIAGTIRPRTYWGRLGQRLVESDKKVIVYDIRGVLHASDSVEDATEFYVRQKSEGRMAAGGVFLHHEQSWQPVNTGEMRVTS